MNLFKWHMQSIRKLTKAPQIVLHDVTHVVQRLKQRIRQLTNPN
jgi:hypothetical protein